MNQHRHIMITQRPQFTLGLTLGVVHSMGLYSYDMNPPLEHHTIFTALKVLCALASYSSLLNPQPLETTDLFTVPIVSPFPEHHRGGIIHYIVF